MMAKRDKYLTKFNRTKSMDMVCLCKKFRIKAVSEIRKSKTGYYSQYFTKHETNMKMLWPGTIITSYLLCFRLLGILI